MNYTSLCYLERGDSYLMLHRVKKQNDINKDKWLGVGGHFENGESPEDCMKREVLEETGFTVTKWRYRGIITFVNTVCECEYMHLFTCSEWKGNPKPCDEGELEWIKKAELKKFPMWEGDMIFLDLISSESTPFFSLKLIYDNEKLISYELDGREQKPINDKAHKVI